MKIGPLLTKLS